MEAVMVDSLYPSEPRQRTRTILRDLLVLGILVLLAWCGWQVHARIDDIRVVTDAIQGAGSSVQDGFGSAASAVSGIPVVGSELSQALQAAGGASGGNVVDLAVAGDHAIGRVAAIMGWLVFAVPAVILLVLYLPLRVGQVRRLRCARGVLFLDDDPERQRVLAMRAAFALPLDHLAKYTNDPFGDLVRGDHDALVTALLADSGLAHPAGRVR
jgi:hypothetical protein